MRTPWGYEAEDLGPIISLSQFHVITDCAYMDNPRVESALLAASQAIRNYCGWHISPSVKCTAYPEGGAVVAKLPAGYVSEIVKITEDGSELSSDEYEWRRDGLLKRTFPHKWSSKWDSIKAEYMAGYEAEAVPDLVEAICAITTGVMSVSAGVISESADGVSISYSQSASSIAAGLTAAQKSALESYKVVSSHGA